MFLRHGETTRSIEFACETRIKSLVLKCDSSGDKVVVMLPCGQPVGVFHAEGLIDSPGRKRQIDQSPGDIAGRFAT